MEDSDEVPTESNRTDVHSDDLEEHYDREVLGTVSPASLQDEENVCTSEKSSNHKTYYVFCDYKAQEDNQLDLYEGQELTILERVNEKWWWVELEGRVGYAPANYISSVVDVCDEPWQDSEYFASYSSLKLHLEMLSDGPRTVAYKTAIQTARSFIKDKVVLDFGAGTGILSLFLAKLGGARKVYAVEASDTAKHATTVVDCNGLSSVVCVIQSRGEELVLPEKVDLIVSEWMGTMLIFELMIESVLRVRDDHLIPGGVVWPSHAQLYLVPCTAEEVYRDKVTFWENVYGFDFSPLVPVARSELFGKPIFNHVLDNSHCLSEPVSVLRLEMSSVSVEDLETNHSNFSFKISKPGTFHGFGSWFTVDFRGPLEVPDYNTVVLSTSPSSPLTHWKQDLLVMDTPLLVAVGDRLEGSITIARHRLWRRHLRVDVKYSYWPTGGGASTSYGKSFKLWR